MRSETVKKFKEFIDLLETDIGHIEGFEVRLSHPIKDGEKQRYADIENFIIYYLHKEDLKKEFN